MVQVPAPIAVRPQHQVQAPALAVPNPQVQAHIPVAPPAPAAPNVRAPAPAPVVPNVRAPALAPVAPDIRARAPAPAVPRHQAQAPVIPQHQGQVPVIPQQQVPAQHFVAPAAPLAPLAPLAPFPPAGAPALPLNHLHAYRHPGHVLPPAPVPVSVPGVNYFYPVGATAATPVAGQGGLPRPTVPGTPITPVGYGLPTGSGSMLGGGSTRSQVARWKELKINGQIGSPGQKDKLTYTSLSFQIANARQRGFEDPEICAAVIKAISPGEYLRTYLEMCGNLTLDALIPILRTHFKEKDATLVYSELSNGTQNPSETENDFCLRMMSLRQKVLLMSNEEGGQYTEELVQGQFQKSLATGFRREAIRQQLRNILKTPIDDIHLLKEISDVVMNETEHDSKVKPKTSVNNVKTDTKEKNKGDGAKNTNPIVSEITKLTSQVSQLSGRHAGLQGEMEKLKQELQSTMVPNGGWLVPNFPMWDHTKTKSEAVVPDPAEINSLNTVNLEGPTGIGRGRGRGGFFRGRGGVIFGRGGHNPFGGGRMGCVECIANGAFCRHCFYCGQEGHDCTKCPKMEEEKKNDPGIQG